MVDPQPRFRTLIAIPKPYCVGRSQCIMMPAETGTGLRCNKVITNICELAGIKNIRAKVHGSHHVHNTMHAAFKALHSITSPTELSDLRGRHVEMY
jgi:small subunit ribosomal protein S5